MKGAHGRQTCHKQHQTVSGEILENYNEDPETTNYAVSGEASTQRVVQRGPPSFVRYGEPFLVLARTWPVGDEDPEYLRTPFPNHQTPDQEGRYQYRGRVTHYLPGNEAIAQPLVGSI